ncbi:bifunctional oligoribonuclease/PAP phosphatase NrnA [Leptobacterium sp. I13]|uniref:DHH family phosphoesterase n=1 Tax=Leptobacterium meishanense TaxID=3128904 RepID=UPI0030EDDBD6
MNRDEIQQLKKVLSAPKNIVIIPHKSPDGDAIGSTLGLYHYLKKKSHNVAVIAPNDYPEFLKWMPGEDTIIKFDTQEQEAINKINAAELIFTLDFNDLERIGEMKTAVENTKAVFVMIDHHQQPEKYAAYTYSDATMSSTSEMVYHFIHFIDETPVINKDIASCLYVGIMTDTGSFRFSSTSSVTHKVISNLIEQGAENDAIHNAVYDSYSIGRLHLLGCALKNLTYLEAYNTAFISLSSKELEENNFKKGDTEGFVNYGLSLKGVKFAAIFIENAQEKIIKISLRSKGKFDVNTFARKHFNGGGHINASGGRSTDSLQTTVTRFRALLEEYKSELENS